MSDLIRVNKENGKVSATRLVNDMDHDELLNFLRNSGRPSIMNYKKYGFEFPILGIGGKETAYPLDDSDDYFKYHPEGIIMICPHMEDMIEWGDDAYLQYDVGDLDHDREKIYLVKEEPIELEDI